MCIAVHRPTTITNQSPSAAIILFFVLLIRFLVNLDHNNKSATLKAMEFVDILIVAVTVIVVAIPGK